MSRFGNLEFNREPEENTRVNTAANDEVHFLTQARAQFESGRFEQALRSYAKVLEFNPRNVLAWTGQIRMLIELGEFSEAKLWSEKALETFPNEPELLAAKAVALGRLGDGKAALLFSDASIEERGDSPYVWLARGDVLLSRKEKRAAYCFDKALLLGSNEWSIAWLASRIHSFYQQFARALHFAQQALAQEAARAVIWMQLGQCEMELGLFNQGQNSFERARELDEELPNLARARNAAGDMGIFDRIAGAWRRFRKA